MTPRKINPPHYFMLALAAMWLLARLPGAPLMGAPWYLLGAVPLAAGVGLALWASGQFARAGTNIVPLTPSSALVTNGAFALSRNPMYVGMSLVIGGVAALLNRVLPTLVLPVFVAVLWFRFIRHEEKLMQATFGEAYLRYCNHVRRFI